MQKILRLILLFTLSCRTAAASDDDLQRAMHDELKRSVAQLKVDKTVPPYFIAYQIEQAELLDVQASLGALSFSNQRGYRIGRIDVRVGDPKFDSSHVMRYPDEHSELQFVGWYGVIMPLEDDYAALRRRFWLATDQAYKRAIEDLAVKRGVVSVRDDPDRQVDQAPVPRIERLQANAASRFERERCETLVRELSAALGEFSQLEQSEVWLRQRVRTQTFENSEGTRTRRRQPELVFGIAARTRAEDGSNLWDYDIVTAQDLDSLPDRDQLLARVRDLGRRLTDLRSAEKLEAYTGPVLFTGTAASALFGAVLAPNFWPQPRYYQSEMDVADAADSMNGSAGAFARRINARILPRGTSVVDDPTRTQFGDQVLQSTLAFDDEGVTTQAKTLVQDGRIRQVLCSRTPTSKTCTPGNFRGGAVLGSTLLLQSQNALSATDMDAQLTRLAREAELPFALEVERLPTMEAFTRLQTSSDNEWDFGQGTTALRAYKRYPDGRRVAVRNVRLSPIDLRDFRNLAGIGDTPALYSKPISYDAFAAFTAGFSFQDQRLSFAVPALLFDDLTADSDRKSTRKLPLLISPNMR